MKEMFSSICSLPKRPGLGLVNIRSMGFSLGLPCEW